MTKPRAAVAAPPRQPRLFTPKRIAIAAGSLLLAILCAYRLLTFVPQPLDSPGTLRPALHRMFAAFTGQTPAQAQLSWGNYSLLALLIPTLLAWINYLRPRADQPQGWLWRVLCSRTLLFASVAVSLFICRFPALLADQLNPDEPLFVAAAQKLFHDPIFFRSVDCGTSGPLNIYPLMLPALFGFSPDYASSRLVGLIVIFCGIYVVYRAFAVLAGDRVARIAMLPAAGAFAVLKHFDFLHYSSEHVSFVLLAAAIYFCVKILHQPQAHAWPLAWLGMLTAATFFAKIQAVPIVACASFVAIAQVHRCGRAQNLWRPPLLFAAGLAPLLLLNAIVCAAAGVWHDFWMEYITANYRYAGSIHQAGATQLNEFVDLVLNRAPEVRITIIGLLAILAVHAYRRGRGETSFPRLVLVGGAAGVGAGALLQAAGPNVTAFAGALAVWSIPAAVFFLWRDSDADSASRRWFGFLVAAVLAAAVVAAYTPHRPFGHYLLLLIFPLAIAMAWPVVSDAGEPAGSVSFLAAFTVLLVTCQFLQRGSPDVVNFAEVRPSIRTPDGALIDSLTQPADEIAVWGWDAKPYVAAARASATPDITTANLFFADPEITAYYRQAYLKAMRAHTPKLFIDATGTSAGGADQRDALRMELAPEIKWFVDSNFAHLLDAHGQRYFIQRDLARSVAGMANPRKCDPQALRCFEWTENARQPADLPPAQIPERAIIEAVFTPVTDQEPLATVFSNTAGDPPQGFAFQHVRADRYRVTVASASQWRLSKEIPLPQRTPASLAIEIAGRTVTIVCNGTKVDEMDLPEPMANSSAPFTVGASSDRQRPFLGNIQFFQIRNRASEK